MEPTVIMSPEFLVALQKEIDTMYDVIINYEPDENIFVLEDYIRYTNQLIALKDWLITE